MSDDMPCVIAIRRNSDGVIRVYRDILPFKGPSSDFMDEPLGSYQWGEGNYSCDCNRALLFARVMGDNAPERECGRTAYSVQITAVEDGRVLYEDEDWSLKKLAMVVPNGTHASAGANYLGLAESFRDIEDC